jgi:hypothetical protein
MGQFFTDDIDFLLKSGHGDSARLTKIKSEFESTKLVSIEDRKYVEGLISRYSQIPKPEKIVKIPEPRIVPPPPPPRTQSTLLEVKQKPKKDEKIPKIESKSKIRNIAIVAGAVIIAIIAAAYVTVNQDQQIGTIPIDVPVKGLELDATSYARGDIVSISGKTSTVTQIAKLAITNPAGAEIWSETTTVKPSGTFSTLVIAGGDGWDQAGKYTVMVSYSGNSESVSFDFNPS